MWCGGGACPERPICVADADTVSRTPTRQIRRFRCGSLTSKGPPVTDARHRKPRGGGASVTRSQSTRFLVQARVQPRRGRIFTPTRRSAFPIVSGATRKRTPIALSESPSR